MMKANHETMNVIDVDEAQAIGKELATEAVRASVKFEPFNSSHEGLAVILEEYEELKREVFKKQSEYDMVKMRKEAVHLGAMALRFIYDVCDK
jgi:hypothetical protein